MSSGRAIRLGIVLLMAGPVGCAAVGLDAPRYEVLSSQAATGSLTADAIRPLIRAQWTYERPQSDSESEFLLYRRGPTQRFGADWVTHQGNERSEYWRMDDQGNVVLTAVISHVDRAISLFQPPLIIAYRELSPGEKRQHEVSMRVVDARNPSRQRESGTAKQTVQYVGDFLIRTPMGETQVQRVDMSFIADLQFADAITTSVIYVADGVGPVVEQRLLTVKVLGLSTRRRLETLLLTSKSSEDSETP